MSMYGSLYGATVTTTVVVPSTPTTPIESPETTNEPEPVEHVAQAIERLLEQYKP